MSIHNKRVKISVTKMTVHDGYVALTDELRDRAAVNGYDGTDEGVLRFIAGQGLAEDELAEASAGTIPVAIVGYGLHSIGGVV